MLNTWRLPTCKQCVHAYLTLLTAWQTARIVLTGNGKEWIDTCAWNLHLNFQHVQQQEPKSQVECYHSFWQSSVHKRPLIKLGMAFRKPSHCRTFQPSSNCRKRGVKLQNQVYVKHSKRGRDGGTALRTVLSNFWGTETFEGHGDVPYHNHTSRLSRMFAVRFQLAR